MIGVLCVWCGGPRGGGFPPLMQGMRVSVWGVGGWMLMSQPVILASLPMHKHLRLCLRVHLRLLLSVRRTECRRATC
jgi:hypothetical protein